MNYPKLIKEIYKNAKEKGLWNHNNPQRHISEINREVSELTSAIISNHNAKVSAFDHTEQNEKRRIYLFEQNIKNSKGDELADIAIMILSLAGHFDILIDTEYCSAPAVSLSIAKDQRNPFVMINRLHKVLGNILQSTSEKMFNDILSTYKLSYCISETLNIATYFNIDIEYHIKYKMWYNSTRNYKHEE